MTPLYPQETGLLDSQLLLSPGCKLPFAFVCHAVSLVRMRLQGPAPLGGNFTFVVGSKRLRSNHHPMKSINITAAPASMTKPIIIARDGNPVPCWSGVVLCISLEFGEVVGV